MQANDDRLKQLGVARFIDERELAGMTGLKARTLQRWRVFDKGPRFHKLGGAVRYQLADIEEWLAACPVGGRGATR